MSMTREEAAVQIESLKDYCEHMAESDESGAHVFDLDEQALDLALAALRFPTREMVERMRGAWIDDEFAISHCSLRGYEQEEPELITPFCPNRGAPMTDEAVDILRQRWKEVVDGETD